MKQLYTVLIFFTLNTSAFAQQDFRKGYIIQNGDTLKGYVDYRGDRRSALVASFKPDLESRERSFGPDAIDGYGFEKENKIFESKTVPATSPDTQPLSLFVNTLVKGHASIYYYRDAMDAEHYYLSMNDGALVELLEQEYYHRDPGTGRNYKVTRKLFSNTLANAFSACNSLSEERFQRLRLSANSLTDIALEYNRCVNPASLVHEQEKRKVKVTIGPVVAFTSSSLTFKGDTYLSRSSFTDESPTVAGGVATNFTVPQLSEKVSLQVELLYVPNKFYALLEEKKSFGSTTTYETMFDLAYLKLPVQVRYTYPRGQLRPFLNAGLVVGHAIKDENQVLRSTGYGAPESQPSSYPAIPGNGMSDGFRRFTQGLTAGAGLAYPFQKGTVSLEARYERNNGMSYINGISSTVSTLYIMLGYGFR
ncbi:outer membrane protein with beta-barrel domain [Pontibacter mucosus]|uniref:Outer membrane protein with beta-barrel domain n=1 Tax=Pontibacter mucosus TaxID=1649266 RepID=A0A2T5Y3H5_9BACT|nr:porin family protein [Pontibacter mucosus]PTX10711.1 outer membrane protein with beta-barrel domain [Pontibacter mucosus]